MTDGSSLTGNKNSTSGLVAKYCKSSQNWNWKDKKMSLYGIRDNRMIVQEISQGQTWRNKSSLEEEGTHGWLNLRALTEDVVVPVPVCVCEWGKSHRAYNCNPFPAWSSPFYYFVPQDSQCRDHTVRLKVLNKIKICGQGSLHVSFFVDFN